MCVRPANSPGFPVSLTVLLQISRSHGLGTETHGFCFLSPAVYKLRVNKCSLGPIIALKCRQLASDQRGDHLTMTFAYNYLQFTIDSFYSAIIVIAIFSRSTTFLLNLCLLMFMIACETKHCLVVLLSVLGSYYYSKVQQK